MGPYIADFLNKLNNVMGYLAGLTTIQIILAIGAGFIGLIFLAIIFTKGGPRQRMKGMRGPWVVVPVVVAVIGGVAWFIVTYVAPGRVHL
jgi:hypothetical protein